MTRPKRSRILDLTALFFLWMAGVNAARAWQADRNLLLLAGWELALSMRLLLAVSLVWAAVFLVLGWGLWRRRGWARRTAIWAPAVYGSYSTGLVLLFTRNPYAQGRWTLIAIGWTLVTLVLGWLLTQSRFKIQFGLS